MTVMSCRDEYCIDQLLRKQLICATGRLSETELFSIMNSIQAICSYDSLQSYRGFRQCLYDSISARFVDLSVPAGSDVCPGGRFCNHCMAFDCPDKAAMAGRASWLDPASLGAIRFGFPRGSGAASIFQLAAGGQRSLI